MTITAIEKKKKIRNLQQITKEKKKEIKGKEKEKHTSKKCSANWKRKIARTKLEQSQEQAEKKRLGSMSKEIGKSKRGNERKRKFKN